MEVNNLQRIVFFDGDCGFCNRSVQFALNHERKQEIHFCALQSEFAKNFFRERNFPQPDLSTFYFWDGKRIHQKSGAGLRLAAYMRFPTNLLFGFIIVPKVIRDYVYDVIAKRRHRISAGFCMLPTPEQKKRFIPD